MFISLEGIDGAGKSSVAQELAALLEASGESVRLLEHNAVRADDPFVDSYLDGLHGLWRTSVKENFSKLGDLHWVLARASYYAILDHCEVSPALARGQAVIADGWFYKFASRIASNGSLSPSKILSYFDDIRRSDRTFLLDVDPRQAAERLNHNFNNGELGPMNIGTKTPLESFISYQSNVRKHLILAAQDNNWDVIDSSAGSAHDAACHILASLDTIQD